MNKIFIILTGLLVLVLGCTPVPDKPVSTHPRLSLSASEANAISAKLGSNSMFDGFATVPGDGQETTTGGLGGDTTLVTSGDQLNEIMLDRKDAHFDQDHPPLVLLITGTLHYTAEEMLRVKETYDLSILGVGDSAVIEGFGLNIYKSHNIIVRNIEFRNCPDDAINIDQTLTHHIWVDHCTFSDSPDIDPGGSQHDGLLDVKHGASFVTISWNHFYNHSKTCLMGHSDSNGAEDIGRLKVSYHHNWFDNTYSRHPRVRFGEAHVFNNYYDNSSEGMLYGTASTMNADVLVEANYFNGVLAPTHVGYGDSAPGDLVEVDNIFYNSGTPEVQGTVFNPSDSYFYMPDAAADVPDLVMGGSGSGKIDPLGPVGVVETWTPSDFYISQNFPNPFNPTTRIEFGFEQQQPYTLDVYDVSGRHVRSLGSGITVPGTHTTVWDGRDDKGYTMETGIYLARLQSGQISRSVKMLLLR